MPILAAGLPIQLLQKVISFLPDCPVKCSQTGHVQARWSAWGRGESGLRGTSPEQRCADSDPSVRGAMDPKYFVNADRPSSQLSINHY